MRKLEVAEVFRLAIAIEEGAARVYQIALEHNKHPAIVKMARILVQQEQGHRAVFQGWLEQAESGAAPAGEGVINPKAAQILEKYFPDLKEKVDALLAAESAYTSALERVSDPVRFIELGIQIEETSVYVYSKLANFVVREGRGQIDRITDEERQHLKNLLSLKSKVLDLKRS